MARALPLFFFLLLSAALVPPPAMAMAEAAGPPKVPLALYYESLCPYCSRFIVNHLAGIFKNGLIDAVDILLVPYGNAHVRGANNTISCQHPAAHVSTGFMLIADINPPLPSSSAHSKPANSLASASSAHCSNTMAARLHHFLPLAVLLLLVSAGDVVAVGNEKVRVALYYESLCPDSVDFIVNHLAEIFKDGLVDATNVTLVPYGNAKVGANGAISCQHGPYECLLNNVEACAIDAWPDLNVHFGFIHCVEGLVMNKKREEWESCFQKQNLDPKPVMECYNNERGQKLSLKYGKQTDALVPPHKYVPWVVVDGEPLYDDYENFEAYVCKAYKGHPPKACQELSRRYPIVQQVVKAGNGVSYNSFDAELDDRMMDVSYGVSVHDSIDIKRIKMVRNDGNW